MSTNEKEQTIEEQEEKLYSTCLKKLQGYFDDEVQGGDEVVTAIKTANMLVKREQSKGAREAVHFAMAQAVCSSPEQLEQYVKMTQPVIAKITGK